MRTFEERKQCVQTHMTNIKRRRRKTAAIITSSALVLCLVLAVLFVPYDTTPPDVSQYADSEYYELIRTLNLATYEKPVYKNNFQAMRGFFSSVNQRKGGAPESVDNMMPVSRPMPGAPVASAGQSDQYQEITDNQVAGVIESDLIKRSDRHIYYLRNHSLYVYSIKGTDSDPVTNVELVGTYTLPKVQQAGSSGSPLYYHLSEQMYLSQDCTTVTVVRSAYDSDLGRCIEFLNLDVTEPANITKKDSVLFSGNLISTRMVDGNILLAYQHYFQMENIDFDDLSTFVPGYKVNGEMHYVDADNILCPDGGVMDRYTVVCTVDGDSLEVTGSAALMGYSNTLYVSQDTMYLSRAYSIEEETTSSQYNQILRKAMTEITGISYGSSGMEILGTVALEGSIKDQYSMDAFDGILRVVTSTTVTTMRRYGDEPNASVSFGQIRNNVNLYCVDLSAWEIRASVIGFAPEGEDAQSVRFDGHNAYVCTAQVVTFTDPVYFFDLSDLDHITYTDTGTIDGYSTSLIQLGDGYLLGIGYGDSRDRLKIEVYQQSDNAVISVCSYEVYAHFSTEYKSYLIDREQDLVGLGIYDWENDRREYILLHFDGYQLNRVVTVPVDGVLDHMRAVLIGQDLLTFWDASDGFALTPIQ